MVKGVWPLQQVAYTIYSKSNPIPLFEEGYLVSTLKQQRWKKPEAKT